MSRLLAVAARTSLAVCLTASLAGPVQAERLGKGRSLVLVGISGHTGQFVVPGPFNTSAGEVGGQAAYYHFMSDQWTLGGSVAYLVSKTTRDENNPNGSPLATDKFDSRSFAVSVGGDRYAFIGDDVAIYAGPGVFYARGRLKDEFTVHPPAVGGASFEGPNTTEVGGDGHVGMYARLQGHTALYGHVGLVLSRASGEDPTGKVSWWSSTPEGSFGLAFDF